MRGQDTRSREARRDHAIFPPFRLGTRRGPDGRETENFCRHSNAFSPPLTTPSKEAG
jgi:hypothetical protein